MGMALPQPEPRNPHKLANGLMHCEWCPCTYSRGSEETGHWYSGQYLNKRDTLPPKFRAHGQIPDNVCPRCRREEEPYEYSGDSEKKV